jgi:hypothetical protein
VFVNLLTQSQTKNENTEMEEKNHSIENIIKSDLNFQEEEDNIPW